MYEFQNDYVKPEYGEKLKLCYLDIDIVYIKIDNIYKALQMILKLDLILQIMNQMDHCLKEKIKKEQD